jgi:hypothetical protein
LRNAHKLKREIAAPIQRVPPGPKGRSYVSGSKNTE